MESLRAYGAAAAGGKFDIKAWLKRPTVLLRIAATLIGLVVWRSVSTGCWHKTGDDPPFCLFNRSETTCSATSAIGFFGFASGVALLLMEARFDQISAVQTRKRVVLLDLCVSGAFTLLFLLLWIVTWSKWSSMDDSILADGTLESTSSVKYAIAGCFFSAVAWGGATFFVWRKYYEGSLTEFAPPYQTEFTTGGEGYGYGQTGTSGVVADSYQNAPFVAINNMGSPVDMKQFQQGY